ncbi:MAG: hypothetical protein AB7F86_13075 [Bdellovibrionales bacterium]
MNIASILYAGGFFILCVTVLVAVIKEMPVGIKFRTDKQDFELTVNKPEAITEIAVKRDVGDKNLVSARGQ